MANWEPVLTEMIEQRYRSLKAYAIVLCGDPAEADDLVQEALVATFGKLRRFPNVPAAEGYVRRAIANKFVDARRKDKTWRTLAPKVAQADESPTAGPDLLAEHSTDVGRALRALPPRQRACVALRFIDQLSTRETAEALGISEGAVKRYVSDATTALAPLLGESFQYDEPEWAETKVAK